MRALLPGETVLKSSTDSALELTNYRVRFNAAGGGDSRQLSIPLDAIASCGVVIRTKPWLLIAAGVCVALAALQYQSPAAGLLVLLAVGFAISYFLTRSGVITVSSSGGEDIVIPSSGMGRDQITPFLDAVLEARLRSIGQLPAWAEAAERTSAGVKAAA